MNEDSNQFAQDTISNAQLAEMAGEAAFDPHTMAYAMRRYRDSIQGNDGDLHDLLATRDPAVVLRLALAKQPTIAHYAEDLRALAQRYGVDVVGVATIVGYVCRLDHAELRQRIKSWQTLLDDTGSAEHMANIALEALEEINETLVDHPAFQ